MPTRDLVFVVGSGVSWCPPSGLPTGAHLRTQVLGDLMRCAATVLSPSECSRLKAAVAGESFSIPDGAGSRATVFGIPFEGLLDIHRQLFPVSDRVARFLTDNLVGAPPNPAHEFLAAGLVASPSLFPRVVTLNYDELIESARPGTHWQGIRVTTETDYRAWRAAGAMPLLFKLHGSFHAPDTVVATLSTEHGLARWKRDLLRETVSGRVLVMVGYSGYDFDVCPVLLESKPRYVYWNTLNPDAKFPVDAQELIDRGGRHVFGDVMDLFEAIRDGMTSSSSIPAVSRGVGTPRGIRALPLSEDEALSWLVRVVVEVGVGDLALKLIKGLRSRHPARGADFSVLRDEARAHFLLDHTPGELEASKRVYRRALERAPSALDAADVWINYHEPCRLGLKYGSDRLRKAASGVQMLRALVSAWSATVWRSGTEVARLRGYVWLRWAQVLENLTRQTRLSRWSWTRRIGYALTRRSLSRARRCFAIDDNYFGSLQTERILLRVSSAPQPEQLKMARSMRDYYRRLGYLTAWSNSNRDVIDVMQKGSLDLNEARQLAREALEVSGLAGDRPGMSKAKELLAALR